jgi:hypothetical protein
MDKHTSNAPQGDAHELDDYLCDDYLCPACGAHYLPDRFALECDVCAAEDHTVEAPF